MHNKKRREEELVTTVFVKQAESPTCTNNRILIVAEDFQGLLGTSLSSLPTEKQLPINISHLLSKAIWVGI